MMMEAKFLTDTKFLKVVDAYAGYCQLCHESRVVGRIAVAGWEHHGTICSQCLTGLADEVQRRGKGLGIEKAGKTGTNGDALPAILGSNGNGNGHSRDSLGH
jgi:hypothetical protein